VDKIVERKDSDWEGYIVFNQ